MLQPKLYRLEHLCEHSTIPKPQVCFSVPAGNGRGAPQRLGAVICSFAALWDAVLVFLLALLSLLCCPKRDSFSWLFVSVTTPLRQARSVQGDSCHVMRGWPHRLSSFAGLRFHGLGGSKFPISVWFRA